MKLYYSKGACSLVPRIVIYEIGLKSEFESVNLKDKVTESGTNFLEINPKGAVPVLLTDNGKILTENAVIQQYLADTHHATDLLPPISDFNRYRVLEWLNYVSTDLHKGFGPLFNPKVTEEMKKDVFRPNLISKLKIVDKSLGKSFIMGSNFTLPDAYLFVMIYWLPKVNISLDEFANLGSYFERLKERDSVAKAIADEGLKV